MMNYLQSEIVRCGGARREREMREMRWRLDGNKSIIKESEERDDAVW